MTIRRRDGCVRGIVPGDKILRAATVRWASIDEVQRFLHIAGDDRYGPLWILALHTGMRRGELLGLRWQDVDLDQRVLRIRQSLVQSGGVHGFQAPKTSSGRRMVALDAATLAALRQQRAQQMTQRLKAGTAWQDHDLVFGTEIGSPLHPSNINRHLVGLMAKAGVTRIPFHSLRHTHATMLMMNGVHPKVASEQLGHAGIAITLQTYSHVVPGLQREAVDIVGAALHGNA